MSAHASPIRFAFRPAAGFNMVELLVVITIVSILMGIGVPSYRYVTNSSRVSTEVNSLLGDMQFARSEAVKQGQTVSVCPSSDGANCINNGTEWQHGWIVFTDNDGDGVVDPNPPKNDMILKKQIAFSGTDTFTPDDNTVTYVRFNREGFAAGLPANGVNIIVRTNPGNAQWIRCLNMVMVGLITTARTGQGTCPAS